MMKSRVAEEQTPLYLTRSALIDTGDVADKILAPEINGSSSGEIRQGINLFKPCRQQQYRDSVKNIKYNSSEYSSIPISHMAPVQQPFVNYECEIPSKKTHFKWEKLPEGIKDDSLI